MFVNCDGTRGVGFSPSSIYLEEMAPTGGADAASAVQLAWTSALITVYGNASGHFKLPIDAPVGAMYIFWKSSGAVIHTPTDDGYMQPSEAAVTLGTATAVFMKVTNEGNASQWLQVS